MTATATPAPLVIMGAASANVTPPPLLPVWRRMNEPRGDGRMTILYTSLLGKTPQGDEYLLTGGMNVSTIYDFCGGCFATSFNARATPLNRRWMDSAAAQNLAHVPKVEDYLGADWFDRATAAYGEHAPVGGAWSTQQGTPGMLSRLVGASVFARLMLSAGASNQNIVSFWDKVNGSTRAWLKYGATVFRGLPLRAPRSYAQQLSRGGTWGIMESTPGRASLYLGHSETAVPAGIHRFDEVTTVACGAVSPGRAIVNRNSGNRVSAGAVFLDSGPSFAPRGITMKFAPHARLRVLDDAFCGPHIHEVGGVTQNLWYSMG